MDERPSPGIRLDSIAAPRLVHTGSRFIRYCFQQFYSAALALFFMVSFCFFILHLMPGSAFLGERALDSYTKQAMEFKLGLNGSLFEQYLTYLWRLLHGDLGLSFSSQGTVPVAEILASGFKVSFILGSMSLCVASFMALSMSLAHELSGKLLQGFIRSILSLGVMVPSYFFAGLFVMLFAVKLRWFPIALLETPSSYVMPIVILSIRPMSLLGRIWIATLQDYKHLDFARTARAKGLSEIQICARHLLRPTLLPVISILGSLGPSILAGSFIVESIFALPGMGKGFVSAILARDYPVVMGSIIVYGSLVLFLRFFTQVSGVSGGPSSASQGIMKTIDIDLLHRLETPSVFHLFGTDDLGRDLLLRVLEGVQVTAILGLFASFLCFVVAVPLGALFASLPKSFELLIHRILDSLAMLPPILLAMMFSVTFAPSLWELAFILSLSAMIGTIRLTHILVRQQFAESYVEALKALGASQTRIILKHILPALSNPLKSAFLSQLPHIVLTESFLSFLGLGLQAPDTSLGLLAAQGWRALEVSPHLFFFPCLALTGILMAIQLPFQLSVTERIQY